ncbi:MAG: ABC transporter permease [Armatimonadetes bacterium]|nr:ABC transporter permease [Armatimonadota bacterium]
MKSLLARRETGILGLVLVAMIVVQAVNPLFLSAVNVRDLLVQNAPFAIVACGMTLVVVVGEIDVSVGAMAGLLASVLGTLSSPTLGGWSPPAAIAVTLGLGGVLGLANGLLVSLVRLPSIIVTLAALSLYRGCTEVMLGGKWITDLPPGLRTIGTGALAGVPVPVIAATAVVALAATAAVWTPFGRRAYAVGSDPHAADVTGLRKGRIKLVSFVLLGVLTALATVVSVPRLSVIESGFGTGWELFVITCVVVGGVSITGGRGSVIGALFGVFLLGTVRTELVYLRLGDQATYWERAVQGLFILGAVVADRIVESRSEREALAT